MEEFGKFSTIAVPKVRTLAESSRKRLFSALQTMDMVAGIRSNQPFKRTICMSWVRVQNAYTACMCFTVHAAHGANKRCLVAQSF